MKKDEVIAYKYLINAALGKIVHEPDGNIPPDFALGRDLAVEVRRLNQGSVVKGKVEGLENQSIKLWVMLESLARSYTKSKEEKTYWISYRYSRPLPPIRDIRKRVKNILDTFIKNPTDGAKKFKPLPNLTIEIFYLGPVVELDCQRFAIAAASDRDGAGFGRQSLLKNIEYCLAEKSEKVREYLPKYSRWWLVLIDYISPLGLTDNERSEIESLLPAKGCWEKVILLDPASGKETLFF